MSARVVEAGASASPVRTRSSVLWALAVFAFVAVLLYPTFRNAGPLVGVDLPIWTNVGQLLRTEIVPEQKWFWGVITPRENAGQVLGSVYSTNLMLLWLLNAVVAPALAVKLACLISLQVFGLGVFLVSARWAPPAFAAVIAAVGVVSAFQLVMDGMWYNILSLGLALCFAAAADAYVRRPSARWWLAALALLSATLYTHPLGAITGGAIWMGFLIADVLQTDRRRFHTVCLACLPIAAALLAAPQVFAVLGAAGGSPAGGGGAAAGTDHLLSLLCINLVDKRVQLLVIVAGIWGVAFNRRVSSHWRWSLAVWFAVNCVILLRLPNLLPFSLPLVGSLLYYAGRFQYSLMALYLVAATAGLAACHSAEAGRLGHRLRRWPAIRRLAALAAVMLLAGYSVHQMLHHMGSARQLTLETSDVTAEVEQLFAWLDQHVDGSRSRVFVEGTNGSYQITTRHAEPSRLNRSSHILALMNLYTRDVNQIGAWCPFGGAFSRQYRSRGDTPFGLLEDEQSAFCEAALDRGMRDLNCQYLVAHSARVKELLERAEFLSCIAGIGSFSIYHHQRMTPGWAAVRDEPDTVLRVTRQSSVDYRIDAQEHAGQTIVTAFAYHRRWRARAGDERLSVFPHRALIAFQLPDSSSAEVELTYEISRTVPLAAAAAGLVLALVLASCLRIQHKQEE